ncbi:hypothetical protein REPUB_Repub15cG0016400 [Reevesia pubescens]
MACSIDHLQKVASEGFPLTDEHYDRQVGKAAHRRAPPPRKQDHYHHQKQQLVPNQYVYHGPQTVTVIQQPDTDNYHQVQTTKNYERWYVCQKVASEGFPLTDEHYDRQAGKAAHRRAPPPTKQDHYHHQKQQLVPNQYVYHGPQTITVVQQPDTGNYHQVQTTKNYERWYVCQV